MAARTMNPVCKRAAGFICSFDPSPRAPRSCGGSYHEPSGAREGPTAGFDLFESATVCGESATRVHRIEHGAPLRRPALGEDVFDESPARAGRAHVGAPFQSAAEPRKASAHGVDPGEGRAVERRIAFGAEGRDAERDGDALR